MHESAIDITNVLPFLLTLAAGGGVGVVLLAYAIRKLFGMESDKAIHFMVMGCQPS
jgi:choline-glycine betaine transporter